MTKGGTRARSQTPVGSGKSGGLGFADVPALPVIEKILGHLGLHAHTAPRSPVREQALQLALRRQDLGVPEPGAAGCGGSDVA